MPQLSRTAGSTATAVLLAMFLLSLVFVAWTPPQAASVHQPAQGPGADPVPASGGSSFGALRGAPLPVAATPALAENTWAELGPRPLLSGSTSYAGRATAMVVNASNSLNVYLGTAGGGVWKSEDGGASWTPLTDSQPSLAVGALALSPDQKTIYAGTGDPNHMVDSYYGAGILKSSDGGKTWSVLGASVFSQSAISGIVISASNPSRIVASTTFAVCCKNPAPLESSFGVGAFLSTDGGSTWTETLPSPPGVGMASLVVDPSNPNVIYAGDFAGALWRSTDGGASWSIILSEPSSARQGRVAVAVTAAMPGAVFAGFSTKAGGIDMVVRYSTGNGTIFYMTSPSPPPTLSDPCQGQCNTDLVLAADPSNARTIYLGAIDLYRSTDGGRSWTDLGGYSGPTHADQQAVAFSPLASSTLFLGNGGGAWKSTDQGSTWIYLNTGLGTAQFESIAPGPGGTYLGATKDNGCIQYGGGTSWNQLLGGDAGWAGYERSSPSILYCTHGKISFYRSTDGGRSWQSAQLGLDQTDGSAAFVPVAQDSRNGGNIYLGTVRVYKSTDYAQSWSDISGDLGGGPISALAVSPSNSSVLWLGDTSGNIRISYQSGTVWTAIAQKNGVVTGLAVNASNPYQAYASVSQVGVVRLTRTRVSPPAWQVLTLPSPKYSADSICIDPTTNYVYVGTDSGVYYSSDGGNSWLPAGVGLPNAPVYNVMATTNGLLVAATHGRGAWSLPLLSSVTLTLSYSASGGGSAYSPPSLSYVYAGQQRLATLSSTAASFKADYGSSWSVTNPLSGSTDNERWITPQTTSGQATADTSLNLTYYHQYLIGFNFTLAGGGTGFSAPTVRFTQFGHATSASAGAAVWVDAGTTYTYPSSLQGSTTTERWETVSSSGTATGPVKVLTNYFHQYLVSLSYAVAGGGTPPQPIFEARAFGFSLSQPLTQNAIPYWLDAEMNYSVTNPIQATSAGERWFASGANGILASPGPLTFTYWHQYSLTIAGPAFPVQWYDAGVTARVNISGVYGRGGGVGQRLASYSLDNGSSAMVQPTSSTVTIPVAMNSPHVLALASKTQYEVNLDFVAREALNSSTPPTIVGDNYWYDAGTPVKVILNGVWNRTEGAGDRLVSYSTSGNLFKRVSTLKTVTVLSLDHISSPQSVSAGIVHQCFVDTTAGSLASLTPTPITGDTGWYDQGSTLAAAYNYVWNNAHNQSRSNAVGYSIGGGSLLIARSGQGTFKVSFDVLIPTRIGITYVTQYRLSVSGGYSTASSTPSPTGDGFYDAGTSTTVSTSYVWGVEAGRSRVAVVSYMLDGVTQNVTNSEVGNFTTPALRFNSAHQLTFNSVKQFFVSFKFVDSSGLRAISPSAFQIKLKGGQLRGSPGVWLDEGTQLAVTGVTWENADISQAGQTIYTVTGPQNITVRCRIYDLRVRATDPLGVPISGAAASVTLANGTELRRQTAADGTIGISLAPVGRFNVTISNLGLSSSASGDASSGAVTDVQVPLSYATISLTFGIVAVVGATYFLSRRRRREQRKEEAPKEPPREEIEVSEDEL